MPHLSLTGICLCAPEFRQVNSFLKVKQPVNHTGGGGLTPRFSGIKCRAHATEPDSRWRLSFLSPCSASRWIWCHAWATPRCQIQRFYKIFFLWRWTQSVLTHLHIGMRSSLVRPGGLGVRGWHWTLGRFRSCPLLFLSWTKLRSRQSWKRNRPWHCWHFPLRGRQSLQDTHPVREYCSLISEAAYTQVGHTIQGMLFSETRLPSSINS